MLLERHSVDANKFGQGNAKTLQDPSLGHGRAEPEVPCGAAEIRSESRTRKERYFDFDVRGRAPQGPFSSSVRVLSALA